MMHQNNVRWTKRALCQKRRQLTINPKLFADFSLTRAIEHGFVGD
jgi:hypothetical protein